MMKLKYDLIHAPLQLLVCIVYVFRPCGNAVKYMYGRKKKINYWHIIFQCKYFLLVYWFFSFFYCCISYREQSDLDEILQSILDLELQSKRKNHEVCIFNNVCVIFSFHCNCQKIKARLKRLGLLKKNARRNTNTNTRLNIAKKLTSFDKKNIIYRSVYRYKDNEDNRSAFTWLSKQFAIIADRMTSLNINSDTNLQEDFALIPVDEDDLKAVNNSIVMRVMHMVGLYPPDAGHDTRFWRVPKELYVFF